MAFLGEAIGVPDERESGDNHRVKSKKRFYIEQNLKLLPSRDLGPASRSRADAVIIRKRSLQDAKPIPNQSQAESRLSRRWGLAG